MLNCKKKVETPTPERLMIYIFIGAIASLQLYLWYKIWKDNPTPSAELIDKACKQRRQIKQKLDRYILYEYKMGIIDGHYRLADMSAVSLTEHIRALQKGQDPLTLYPKEFEQIYHHNFPASS
jgi:hypothetical protein